MCPGDLSLFHHTLRADHNVDQVEVYVREGRQQLRVEAGRTFLAAPVRISRYNGVHTVLGEGRHQPWNIALILCDGVIHPQAAYFAILLLVKGALELCYRRISLGIAHEGLRKDEFALL